MTYYDSRRNKDYFIMNEGLASIFSCNSNHRKWDKDCIKVDTFVQRYAV